MAAIALILMSIGSVLQGLADGTEVNWNKVVTDVVAAGAILGATMHGPKQPTQ